MTRGHLHTLVEDFRTVAAITHGSTGNADACQWVHLAVLAGAVSAARLPDERLAWPRFPTASGSHEARRWLRGKDQDRATPRCTGEHI
jgi:hypothetical protein